MPCILRHFVAIVALPWQGGKIERMSQDKNVGKQISTFPNGFPIWEVESSSIVDLWDKV
jgi:hypothetical protein